MKIVITADLHLTARGDHPERYNALENILSQMREMGIMNIIVAGDLFDKSLQDYSEFEALTRKREYSGITFYVIPGNHDPGISPRVVVSDNVRIFTRPDLVRIDPDGPPFLLLPYEQDAAMGEKIQAFSDSLDPGNWILIGHGDYCEGPREINPYEEGVYMPLTRHDLERFKPATVFLGHIHQAPVLEKVHYPGSPCGLDITETGKRSFIIYGTDTGSIKTHFVDTEVIWFNESFVVIPGDNQVEHLEKTIAERINGWGLDADFTAEMKVRVRATGYSSDRHAVLQTLKDGFSGFSFYEDSEPDVDGVKVSEDEQRNVIAEKVMAAIENLDWPWGPDEPDRDTIVSAALDLIYGE